MKASNTPLAAIRAKCLDCCCDSPHEVKYCPAKDCRLYPFRFGKNPFVKRNLTEEERAKKRDAFISMVRKGNGS